MKVLTKVVILENEKFVLIRDTEKGETFFGTIPYSELDEKGRLKRELNGFDMCISWLNPGDALQLRINRLKVDKYESEGHSKAEVMMFVASDYSTENWDMEKFKIIQNYCDEWGF